MSNGTENEIDATITAACMLVENARDYIDELAETDREHSSVWTKARIQLGDVLVTIGSEQQHRAGTDFLGWLFGPLTEKETESRGIVLANELEYCIPRIKGYRRQATK